MTYADTETDDHTTDLPQTDSDNQTYESHTDSMTFVDAKTDDNIYPPQTDSDPDPHTDNTSLGVQLDETDTILHTFSNLTQNSLPGSKFVDFDTTLQTFTETSHGDNLLVVPDVRKENVFFIIDSDNKMTKQTFIDDCGALAEVIIKNSLLFKFWLWEV